MLVAQESKNFQTLEFLSAEAMGVDLPRRCPSCKNCKECQFRTSAVAYKEDQEFHVILDGLKFNEERRKWTASYPFFIPPSELKDNYQQVKTYTERMEKKLIKQGRVEEFNSQFRDTVERGVFRELSEEELKEWKGPLNYIAMVEAFKNGPHATTPLRICMNSSLKQPPPVKKSLNDCLMKGPSALVDLFTITLSFREHRYALAKDLSKFYQKVEADELTQHMRRILWRDCDGSKEMWVYVTTTVNFGDRPAGCIAIAALRETAERYGADLPIAAWYLKYRTYVDDAVAGSDKQKGMVELSGDLETLAGRGGFQFKGTLMTGDAAADPSEPRKVLGLIWETQEDKLQVYVKLNTGGKVGGARIQEDIDLEGDLSRALPGAITKRVLWRVALGLYDPLGLLCAFTIRFKIVMRSLSDEEEGGRVGWDDQVPAHVEADFREILGHLKDLKKVSFLRSMWPEPGRGQVKGRPMLLIFGDGSVEASCALAYLRWEMEDGSVVCRLLAGKTRVASKCKISIPRMELMGSLVAVRLYQKIKDSLRLEIEGVRYGFVGSPGDDQQGFRNVPRVRGNPGQRDQDQVKGRHGVVLDPRGAQSGGYGDTTHNDSREHGGGHPVPDGAPVDVSACGNLAGQKGLHSSSSRGVLQRCHAGHMRGCPGGEREVDLPSQGDFESQAREDLRLRNDGGCGLQETSGPDVPSYDRGTREQDDTWSTPELFPGGCPGLPGGGRPEEYDHGWDGEPGGRGDCSGACRGPAASDQGGHGMGREVPQGGV